MINPKDLEAKKHQHHVWANYLLRWGRGTNNVHYTSKTGKLAHDSVRGIVVDDYFYKTTPLSNENIEVIKYLSSSSPPFMQKIHMNFLNVFLAAQRIQELYRALGIKDEKGDQIIHALECNMMENLHSLQETGVHSTLSALAEENYEVLNEPENMIELLLFIGHQFARTKTFRDGAIRITNTSDTDEAMSKTMSHAWWFISYMFGMNIGSTLYKRANTSTHTLLINNTDKPFITSDQPVINVHPSVTESGFLAPKMVDFYYPISPRVALIICESKRFDPGRQAVDSSFVDELNSRVAKQTLIHIIGDTREAISPYKKLVGRRYREAFSD
ncbi:DUF4238 domain-containing protein [Pseudomonas poae]|uniref:DUF4238 domain-containing protein n=1 Tax=Pseudomonas poae TaxID=200451 RepID=A0ABY0S1E5_9PSED|nr:DUF4238 domain-containing protein [Pseudomonas poae]KRP41461.1 hypothetical protein TU75_25930 [Pseudomonas poae]SDO70262.1 Protein of unknown function [Pseudomonas poae]